MASSPPSNLTDVSSVEVTQETYENILYRLIRDIVGLGPLEPVMRDPANEDIHVIGRSESTWTTGSTACSKPPSSGRREESFDQWLRNMGERMGDPVSDSDPIVDSTLPDGSRLNLIYSDDVSLKGPSLTIRQGDDVPLSIFQITKWMTLSPQLAAYLWLCLENELTVFVVGETASGKTTTLNAILRLSRKTRRFTPQRTPRRCCRRTIRGSNSSRVKGAGDSELTCSTSLRPRCVRAPTTSSWGRFVVKRVGWRSRQHRPVTR